MKSTLLVVMMTMLLVSTGFAIEHPWDKDKGAEAPNKQETSPAPPDKTNWVKESPASNKSGVLYDNGNIARVYNQPTQSTIFRLNRSSIITLIQNYHWNNAQGSHSSGAIALRDASGRVYGPWPTVGTPGQGGVPNANWTARPNVQLPAGTYAVIDSDPATWSQNSESGSSGFSRIEGYPAHALDQPAEQKTPVKQSEAVTAKEYYERGIRASGYKQAIKEFTKALKLDPTYAEAYLGRGDAYSGLENAKEAIRDFNEYLALRPKDVFGYLKRAVAYSYAGEFQKAIEDMDRVLAEFPKEASFYYERGQLYEAIGKKHQAIDDYKKAAKLGYDIAEDDLKERGIKW